MSRPFNRALLVLCLAAGMYLWLGMPATLAAPKRPAKPAAQTVDAQIRQLLLSSSWCAFSYRNGYTNNEHVTFRPDGTVLSSKQGETYSSGYGGTYASQSNDGESGYWKVASGQVYLSDDGETWAPLELELTFNSSGAPILKADGKEYMRCN